jgi:hypothetical protein
MTTETFFTTSGSSPPVDAPPLPPELVEALAALLADAIVADIRQYPNFVELQTNHEPTVESPSGLNRRRPAPEHRRGPATSADASPTRSPPVRQSARARSQQP